MSATKATLDRRVKQSLIIVNQSPAMERDDVEIHPVGSHVSVYSLTLERHVKQSLIIVRSSQSTAAAAEPELQNVQIYSLGSIVSAEYHPSYTLDRYVITVSQSTAMETDDV